MEKKIIEFIEKQNTLYSLDKSYLGKTLLFMKENNVDYLENYTEETLSSKIKLPKYLFTMGNKDLLKKQKIAIIGARKGTLYGKIFIDNLLERLKTKDIVTISGFAIGIDSYAHEVSLNNDIPTIAILGNGFAINYPARNKTLKERIINNGLFISQYAPFVKPYKHNFIQRNLLIAFFCDILIVVQGNKYSGTLSTLKWAQKLNKKIYALPGDINNKLSYTPNYAIHEGAEIIYDIDKLDFLEHAHTRKHTLLSEEENIILSIVKETKDLNIVLKTAPFEKSEILSIITKLELKGIIKKEFNSIYILEDIDG